MTISPKRAMINTEDLMTRLSALTYKGAEKIYGTINFEIEKRIKFELAFIEKNGGIRELLLAYEIACRFKERNRLMSFGRGCISASILGYCLRITSIDPLKHGLLSEIMMSDTFTDIEVECSEIGDKELQLSFPDVTFFHTTNRPELSKPEYMLFRRLQLNALTIIEETLYLIFRNLNRRVNIDNIPLDDDKTLQLFRSGETDDIWQFRAPGTLSYLKQLKPECFDQLVMLSAMYRPGVMENIPEYIIRKNGNAPVLSGIPEVDEILAPTYGFIVYREQILQLLNALTGIGLEKANVWFKDLGKKKAPEVDRHRKYFLQHYRHDKAEELWERIYHDIPNTIIKSHMVYNTRIAYIMAYLKAHFSYEYATALAEYGKNYL